MDEGLFYRYIYKKFKGYVIQYKNQHYGYYTNLADALFDRDRLENCDWDMEIFVQLPETINPYTDMNLPEFSHDTLYIAIVPQRYVVQKRIDGKIKYFGTYKTLEEARERRDTLMNNNWKEV